MADCTTPVVLLSKWILLIQLLVGMMSSHAGHMPYGKYGKQNTFQVVLT